MESTQPTGYRAYAQVGNLTTGDHVLTGGRYGQDVWKQIVAIAWVNAYAEITFADGSTAAWYEGDAVIFVRPETTEA